eukprot:1158039-Pelagomonas_calceolata.AAC.4
MVRISSPVATFSLTMDKKNLQHGSREQYWLRDTLRHVLPGPNKELGVGEGTHNNGNEMLQSCEAACKYLAQEPLYHDPEGHAPEEHNLSHGQGPSTIMHTCKHGLVSTGSPGLGMDVEIVGDSFAKQQSAHLQVSNYDPKREEV